MVNDVGFASSTLSVTPANALANSVKRFDLAAENVVQATVASSTVQSQEPQRTPEIPVEQSLVNLQVEKQQLQAVAKTVSTADELLGRLIDMQV